MARKNILLALVILFLIGITVATLKHFSLGKKEDNIPSAVNSSAETDIHYQEDNPIFTSAFCKGMEEGYIALLDKKIGVIDSHELRSLSVCLSSLVLNEYIPSEDEEIMIGGTYCFTISYKNGETAKFLIQGNLILVESSISGFENLVGKQYVALTSDESLVDMVMSYFEI